VAIAVSCYRGGSLPVAGGVAVPAVSPVTAAALLVAGAVPD